MEFHRLEPENDTLPEAPKSFSYENGCTEPYKANMGVGFPLHKPCIQLEMFGDETISCSMKIGRAPKGNDRTPTIHGFRCFAVNFREGI